MGTVTRQTTWNDGDKPTATELNGEFNNILTTLNGGVDNTNVNASADMDGSKLLDSSVTSRKLDPTSDIDTCSGDLTLTNAFQDVAGCTVTFTPTVASYALVIGTFDFDIGAGNTAYGTLDVDGSDETSFAILEGEARGTVTQMWLVTLTAAEHTLKLQAKSNSGGGTCGITHSRQFHLVWAQ